MLDREKVIKGLECCISINACHLEPTEDCPYNGMLLCAMVLKSDAVALLEEQNPVSPYVAEDTCWYKCGNCGTPINPDDKFCRKCGKAVKWDG